MRPHIFCSIALAASNFVLSTGTLNAAPPATDAPLAVVVVSPPAGSTQEAGIITVRVQATGGAGGVSRVELYVNQTRVTAETEADDNLADYDLAWDATRYNSGPYSVYAVAYDHGVPRPAFARTHALTIIARNPDRP